MKTLISAFALAAVATAAISAATPAAARDVTIKTGGDRTITLGEEGDLLEQLIALDAQGIEDLRADIADARREIEEAVVEIEDARAELRGVPGARFIVRIAFAAAAEATAEASEEAFADAFEEIDRAEKDLRTMKVSAEERAETQGAIEMIRDELADLEESLDRLSAALKG